MQRIRSRYQKIESNALRCETAGHFVRLISFWATATICSALALASELSQPVVLETTIVGLEIHGRTAFDRTNLKDFDALFVGDSLRYLPVRRLLDALKIPYEERQDSLRFRNASDTLTVIVASEGVIVLSGKPRHVDMRPGVSDVSGTFDVFLPEAEIARLFNLSLAWDEANYAFMGRTESRYPAWARKTGRASSGWGENNDMTADLPEVLPPSRPSLLGDPSIHFLQPGVSYTQRVNDRYTLSNSLGAWGRILGGRYALKLARFDRAERVGVVLEQARVTHRFGDVESTVGDVNLGLSDLVFPRSRLTGVAVNGLLGLTAKERDSDRSDFGRRDVYQARRDFIGTARMGSTIELYLDNRFVAEQLVTQRQWAGPDEGVYEFLDIDLVRDRVNQVRIVITQPDGTVIERNEEVVGSGALLRPGQVSLAAAAGQRRFVSPDFWKTQGMFGGAHLLYGVTSQWSLGGSVGYQNLYSLPYDAEQARETNAVLQDTVPSTSEHYSVQTRFQMFKRVGLSAELATSRSNYDLERVGIEGASKAGTVSGSGPEFAGHAGIDMYLGSRLRLTPEAFYFGPGYFDGNTVRLRNRQGVAVSTRLRFGQSNWFTASYGEVENNVDGRGLYSLRQRWTEVTIPVPRMVPRTNLRVSGIRFENIIDGDKSLSGNEPGARYAVRTDAHSTMLRVCEIEGNLVLGEDLAGRPEDNLLTDLSVADLPTMLHPQWSVRASRQLTKNDRISVSQLSSSVQKLSQLSHIRRASDTNHWEWRVEAGFDWTARDWYLLAQPGYYLDRTGTSQLSLLARYDRRVWYLGLTVRLEPIFSLVGGRPFIVPASRINPSSGGVKGTVFFDTNGNGTREDNEPGVPEIKVIGGGGTTATSGSHGEFLIPAGQQKRRMRVSLDPSSLPAEYTPTNGTQWASLEPGLLTPVLLGVTEPGSVSGCVRAPDLRDTTRITGISALRVVAEDAEGRVLQESVTGSDGAFFLGDLTPGYYTIAIDKHSIPQLYAAWPGEDTVVVHIGDEGKLDWQNVNLSLQIDREKYRQRISGK